MNKKEIGLCNMATEFCVSVRMVVGDYDSYIVVSGGNLRTRNTAPWTLLLNTWFLALSRRCSIDGSSLMGCASKS